MPKRFLQLDPEQCRLSEPLCHDIRLLDSLLGEVLIELEGEELVQLARALYHEPPESGPEELLDRHPALKDPATARKLLRAFTVMFRLLNTAEQKEIVRVNRERQARTGSSPRPESIGEAIIRLQKNGALPSDVQSLLDSIDICPTLTAHPTEARRRAVLDKLQRIAGMLAEADQPAEQSSLDLPLNTAGLAQQDLKRALTALWQTDELRSTPLTVSDEVRNSLYFFENSILNVVTWLHADVRKWLGRCYPGHQFRVPPFIQYRSWVGGDRDGNPNVTAEVTWQTLIHHKRLILQFYDDRLSDLQRDLTLSSTLAPPAGKLVESIESDLATVHVPEGVRERYAAEPYSMKLLIMRERLKENLRQLDDLHDFRAESPEFQAQPPAYHRSSELLDDLLIIQESLRASRSFSLADQGSLQDLIVQVSSFGFRLATLDIRQHSDEHERVLDEMLIEAGLTSPAQPYSTLSEEDKLDLLTRELQNPRPLLARDWQGSSEAQNLLEVFEVVRHAQRYLSPNAVTSYVISMTHEVSDVLEVLLLAKEAGLARWRVSSQQPAFESDIDVVPLFETIEDLRRCDGLMRSLFQNPAYQLHLQTRSSFQEIMLGYSDSSKDGGYLAANWSLHDTQSRLAEACKTAGVDFRFFHGRGGTVGRGGGRANLAILSQPPGSFNGRIRFTEQGEVASFRYGLAPIAHRHVEQIANAVLLAAAEGQHQSDAPEEWKQAVRDLADSSRRTYRSMVYDDPQFWDFYTQATPIAYISQLPITSRPMFRPGRKMVGLQDLRAIPWVFAWVQSRYVVPGWYGVGSALDGYLKQNPEGLTKLKQMYSEWPFFRTIVDNAQLELVRAQPRTAAWYARRVNPAEVGSRIHATIEQEYQLTQQRVLEITGQDETLERALVVKRTVDLRNPLVEPLSKLQVALMNAFEEAGPDHDQWRDPLLLSIAGIAAAMQSTG